jgi:hypothetical protein
MQARITNRVVEAMKPGEIVWDNRIDGAGRLP